MRNESQCLKKRSYTTKINAESVAEKVKEKRGVDLRVYFCPYCYWYHLTKQITTKNTKNNQQRKNDKVIKKFPDILFNSSKLANSLVTDFEIEYDCDCTGNCDSNINIIAIFFLLFRVNNEKIKIYSNPFQFVIGKMTSNGENFNINIEEMKKSNIPEKLILKLENETKSHPIVDPALVINLPPPFLPE